MTAAVAAGSAVAANMDRGSVPSSTLLRGSTTELEDEDDVDEVLPFRVPFLVFDSVTWGGHRGGQGQGASLPTFPGEHARMGFPSSMAETLIFVTNWQDSESRRPGRAGGKPGSGRQTGCAGEKVAAGPRTRQPGAHRTGGCRAPPGPARAPGGDAPGRA